MINKDEILKYIESQSSNYTGFIGDRDDYIETVQIDPIIDVSKKLADTTFFKKNFKHSYFNNFIFSGCQFTNINFVNVLISNSSFENCIFENCSFASGDWHDNNFKDCEFIKCEFSNVSIYSGSFANTVIKGSSLMNYISWNDCLIDGLTLEDCSVLTCQMKNLRTSSGSRNFFKNIFFGELLIFQTDLNSFQFDNSLFIRLILVDSVLGNNTISESCAITGESKNYIGLQTILHSPFSNQHILKWFGITNSDVKQYIDELVTEIKFQSVFISYSFEDKEFASVLNQKLRYKGINTFLWEQDAPGGKRLKQIMKEFVHKYDRILFIASEHSLKSQACHYELSEAREKQDKEWRNVYFPIHIDNYLFEIDKDTIRPKENRDEYWKNIEEIKDVNSVDFSAFRNNCKDNPEFDEKVAKLAKDLKL